MSVVVPPAPAVDPFADLGMLLHDAVRDRNITGYNGIDMLMQFGPSVDYLDDHNNTPLHRSVHAGYLAGVESLLKYNADIMALDGRWGLSSEDLALKVIEVKKAGNAYKKIPEEDLMACYRVLEAARSEGYNQNDADWDIQLRPNQRVEVHGMHDGDMPLAMNGRVGVLQHYVPACDPEEKYDGRWRVGFVEEADRGPAFLHARHLRRV